MYGINQREEHDKRRAGGARKRLSTVSELPVKLMMGAEIIYRINEGFLDY